MDPEGVTELPPNLLHTLPEELTEPVCLFVGLLLRPLSPMSVLYLFCMTSLKLVVHRPDSARGHVLFDLHDVGLHRVFFYFSILS